MVRAARTTGNRNGTFGWIFEAWRIPHRNPPVGSNRELALILLRFLVLVALVVAGLMAVLGLALPNISRVSTGVAIIAFVFTGHLYVFWQRLPLNWIRGTLLGALAFFVLRWLIALYVLQPVEIPVAMLASLVYVPMLLILVGLMEGQRRGVLIGLAVALTMGISLIMASFRPELSEANLSDPRLGFLVAVFLGVYVFFLNAWSGQQTDLEEAETQALLLRERINTDPLTGLLNRRGIDLAVTSLMTRREPFGVLLIDIDHFKSVNDTLGHDVGDRVIKLLAVKLRDIARDQDVVGRWGGRSSSCFLPPQKPRP